MRRIAVTVCAVAAGFLSSGAGEPWTSEHYRDHPLAGRIWDVDEARFIDRKDLMEALVNATFVLLGEQHDNPDHHRLQGEIITALTDRGRRPAVAFEMLESDVQSAVDRQLERAPNDVAALTEAVAWEESGWPEFELYEPVFRAALTHDLPIVAANLPDEARDRLGEAVTGEDDFSLTPWLEGSAPLPPARLDDLKAQLVRAHCGGDISDRTEAMAAIQQAWDAHMAARLHEGRTADGAVLIAGAGHARRDRGVPWHLRVHAPEAPIATLAFTEVAEDETDPRAYRQAFDYLWFTPAADVEDPCAGFHGSADTPEE